MPRHSSANATRREIERERTAHGWTWFATRLWHRWQQRWLFSLYANAVDCAPFSFISLTWAVFFSDSWPLFIFLFLFSFFLSHHHHRRSRRRHHRHRCCIPPLASHFDCLHDDFIHVENTNNPSETTEKLVFQMCIWHLCVRVVVAFCMEFTWDLAPSPLFQEKLALQRFFNRNTHLNMPLGGYRLLLFLATSQNIFGT